MNISWQSETNRDELKCCNNDRIEDKIMFENRVKIRDCNQIIIYFVVVCSFF